MSANQIQRRHELGALYKKYKKQNPAFGSKADALTDEAYKDGALDAKTKRLMALAVAVVQSCEGCTLAQTMYALDKGATVEEVYETCGVAMSIGGTLAASGTTRVMALLDDIENA